MLKYSLSLPKLVEMMCINLIYRQKKKGLTERSSLNKKNEWPKNWLVSTMRGKVMKEWDSALERTGKPEFCFFFLVNKTNRNFLFELSCFVTFSLELRELETKLRLAYLNKERAAQIAEQEAKRFETLVSTALFGSYGGEAIELKQSIITMYR